MIQLYANASYHPETRQPLCLGLWAMGAADEVAAAAERLGMQTLELRLPQGIALAGVDLMLDEMLHPCSTVTTILGLFDHAGTVEWFADLVPGTLAEAPNGNFYPTRDAFMAAVKAEGIANTPPAIAGQEPR